MKSIRVPSFSTPGETHLVEERTDGSLACSCLSYRKATGCAHTKIIKLARVVVDACRQTHGGDGERACFVCVAGLVAEASYRSRRRIAAEVRAAKAEVREKAKAAKERREARKKERQLAKRRIEQLTS